LQRGKSRKKRTEVDFKGELEEEEKTEAHCAKGKKKKEQELKVIVRGKEENNLSPLQIGKRSKKKD
jgi:hypothetical protein